MTTVLLIVGALIAVNVLLGLALSLHSRGFRAGYGAALADTHDAITRMANDARAVIRQADDTTQATIAEARRIVAEVDPAFAAFAEIQRRKASDQ